MNLTKALAAYKLFKAGKEIANADAWRKGTIGTTALVGFLTVFVLVFHDFFGVDIAVTDDQLAQIAKGLLALVSVGVPILHTLWHRDASAGSSAAGAVVGVEQVAPRAAPAAVDSEPAPRPVREVQANSEANPKAAAAGSASGWFTPPSSGGAA